MAREPVARRPAPGARTRAIGAWSGLSAVAGALGPLLGGLLWGAVSWRAVFLINLLLDIFIVAMAGRHVPETRDLARQRTARLSRRDFGRRRRLSTFSSRQFSAANPVMFVVFGALSGLFFLLVAFFQNALGYSPLKAGAASLPIRAVMLSSPRLREPSPNGSRRGSR